MDGDLSGFAARLVVWVVWVVLVFHSADEESKIYKRCRNLITQATQPEQL